MTAVASLCAGVSAGGAEKQTTRYFEQLRRRGLLRLAASVCRRELAREDLTPDARSQYTLELSRTLTEQAKYAVGQEQAETWQQAAGVIASYLKSSPKAPRRNWLQMQRCIALVLRGEFLRWDSELSPNDSNIRRQAVAALKHAIGELREFERTAPRGDSADDRRELQKHVRYQLAIASTNLAVVLPAGSAERKDALQKASAALASLTSGTPATPIAWNSHVLAARVARLEGELGRAADRLGRVQKLKPPATVMLRVEVELVQLLLDKNLPEQADRVLRTMQRVRQTTPGELAFLKVKTLIARWKSARKAGEAKRAADLFQQAEEAVVHAETNVGGYWSYRCRVLLSFLKDARQHGPEVAAAIRKAQAAFEAKRFTAAADEYATAATLAVKDGDKPLAFRLGFTAGSIRLQAGEFETAAAEFQRLAKEYPKHKQTADADLMAAYCLGRFYDSLRTKARRLAYAEALAEHRRRYPKSRTAHEAAWMLATLHEYRGQTTEALKLYLSVPASHPRAAAAQLAASRSYETIINRLRELKKPDDRAAWERHACSRLSEITAGYPKPPAAWNASQAEVALRTARIHLNLSPPDHKAAEPLLGRVIASADAAVSKAEGGKRKAESKVSGSGLSTLDSRLYWTGLRGAARQLRIVSLAGTGRFDDARALLADLEKTGPGEVLVVLDGLMQIGGKSDVAVRERLGGLQLQTALALNRNREKLKPAERNWLDRCLAQAYESMGRTEQAVAVYEQLLAKSPRNRKLLTKVATMLEASSDRDSLRKARRHWQTLQTFDKPGTPGWLTARYHVARCSYRLGDYAESRKLLTVTKLLYPDLGGDDLRGRYELLLQDVNRKLANR